MRMDLCIVDSRKSHIEDLKIWIEKYSLQKNCYFSAIEFTDNEAVSKIRKYAPIFQIALISLDSAEGEACGRIIYENNPECRIMYYRSEPCTLVPLLSSRPISFFLWPKGEAVFLKRFEEMCQEFIYAKIFHYETRSREYLIPKSKILYLQSDLRYVNIHVLQGENPRILSKLAEMEPLMGESFIRVHKSYLVNAKHVLYLDKKNHLVLMCNGEQIPVSDAQYEKACEKLRSVK